MLINVNKPGRNNHRTTCSVIYINIVTFLIHNKYVHNDIKNLLQVPNVDPLKSH